MRQASNRRVVWESSQPETASPSTSSLKLSLSKARYKYVSSQHLQFSAKNWSRRPRTWTTMSAINPGRKKNSPSGIIIKLKTLPWNSQWALKSGLVASWISCNELALLCDYIVFSLLLANWQIFALTLGDILLYKILITEIHWHLPGRHNNSGVQNMMAKFALFLKGLLSLPLAWHKILMAEINWHLPGRCTGTCTKHDGKICILPKRATIIAPGTNKFWSQKSTGTCLEDVHHLCEHQRGR